MATATDDAAEAATRKRHIRRVVDSRDAIIPPMMDPTHAVPPDTIAETDTVKDVDVAFTCGMINLQS